MLELLIQWQSKDFHDCKTDTDRFITPFNSDTNYLFALIKVNIERRGRTLWALIDKSAKKFISVTTLVSEFDSFYTSRVPVDRNFDQWFFSELVETFNLPMITIFVRFATIFKAKLKTA